MAPGIGKLIDRAMALNAIAHLDKDGFSHLGAPSKEGAPLVHVKDNIAVRNMPWTAGSPIFADVRAERDADAVERLRRGGARIAFKTTLHELALGVTGANGWTGAIANPHDASRVAGGSSCGAAAALALGLGDLALVTDTGGSARIPASLCGVYGFRPSTGRYPDDGLIGLSPSRDTIGLMARDLHWIRWADAILAAADAQPPSRALRIGVAGESDLGLIEADIVSAYADFADLAAAAGHRIVPVDLASIFALDEACGLTIAMFETRGSLEASARTLAHATYRELCDAVATPEVRQLLVQSADTSATATTAYAEALDHGWPALQRAFAALFADRIDILCLPTVPVTAPALNCGEEIMVRGSPRPAFPTLSRYTRPDSMAGLPSLSIPFGCDGQGLPMGMMLSAARYADAKLLTFASDFLLSKGFPPSPGVRL